MPPSPSELFLAREAHSKIYYTYGLKGSNEEIVFYEECIEPIPSLVESTPSLAEGLPSLVLGTSSPSSTLKLPVDKGESTDWFSFQSWATSGSVHWALCDPSIAHIGHTTEYGFYGLDPVPYNP